MDGRAGRWEVCGRCVQEGFGGSLRLAGTVSKGWKASFITSAAEVGGLLDRLSGRLEGVGEALLVGVGDRMRLLMLLIRA